MENPQSGNTRSNFILKREKAAAKKEGTFFFFADFLLLSRIPQGMCAMDSAVAAVLHAPNQGKGFRQLGTLRAQRARRIQGH